MKIVVATHNEHKIEEMKKIIKSKEIELVSLNEYKLSVEDVNEEEIKNDVVHSHEVTDEEKNKIHEEITKSFLDSDEEEVETL